MPLVTFVIPLRHPGNARDWNVVKLNLIQTAASIANQSSGDWQAIVVANVGAELPALPQKFSIAWVDFPPNPAHERNALSLEAFYDAFRIDKGRRVLWGMLQVPDSRYFMIVDDDDLVSAHLVQYVSAHDGITGWIITRGYVWNHNGELMMRHDDFNRICGTSLIVRSDVYGLPRRFEEASPDWIKPMLGGHIGVTQILASRGVPLEHLPFRGAVYRVNQPVSHSRTPGLLRRFFFDWSVVRQPQLFCKHALSLCRLDRAIRSEFFGADAIATGR